MIERLVGKLNDADFEVVVTVGRLTERLVGKLNVSDFELVGRLTERLVDTVVVRMVALTAAEAEARTSKDRMLREWTVKY